MNRILVLTESFSQDYNSHNRTNAFEESLRLLSPQYCFYVLTSYKCLNKTSYKKDVMLNKWLPLYGKSVVRYASGGAMTVSQLKNLIKQINPHTIYIRGALSFQYSYLPLHLINQINFEGRIVISPKEDFRKTINIFDALKINYFSYLINRLKIKSNIVFHSEDDIGLNYISRRFGSQYRVQMMSNVSTIIDSRPEVKNKENKNVKCAFYCNSKNQHGIAYAFDILKEVGSDANVELDIWSDEVYGSDTVDSWINASPFPGNIKINFNNTADGLSLFQNIKQYHLFLCPLQKEQKIDKLILDVLSAGCPVLITDQTHLKDVELYNAGWAIPLKSKKLFAEKIEIVCRMNSECLHQMALNAKQYAYAKTGFVQHELYLKYQELLG